MAEKDLVQNFFKKVSTRSERMRAYNTSIDSKSHVWVQDENKNIHVFEPIELLDSKLILKSSATCNIQDNSEAIVTFAFGQEKYFIKTKFNSYGFNAYSINIDEPLYTMQRRGSFRVKIPASYNARIDIESINGTDVYKTFPLGDLSGGGAAIEVLSNEIFDIESGDELRGTIYVDDKLTKHIVSSVRYKETIGSSGSGYTKVGIQFLNLSTQERQRIVRVVLDIHREMFSKFKLQSK